MARQLDFSPLDKRAMLAGQPQYIAQGISQAAKGIAGGIDEAVAQGRKRQAQFLEQMKFDTQITADNAINKVVANAYDDFKSQAIESRAQNKGRVSNEDLINIQSNKQALMKLAGTLKTATGNYEQAQKMMNTEQGQNDYELNTQGWADMIAAMDGEIKGDGEEVDIQQLINKAQENDTGNPFLNWKTYDPDQFLGDSLTAFKKLPSTTKKQISSQVQRGGKRITSTSVEEIYGPAEDAIEYSISELKNSKDAPKIVKGIQAELTDEEKKLAREKYGNDFPNVNYYFRDKKKADIEKSLQPPKDIKRASRIPPTTGGRGAEAFIIEPKDDSWDMRGKPKRFPGKIERAYKNGKPTKVIGTSSIVTGINFGQIPGTQGPDRLYAEVMVPKKGSEIFQRIAAGEEIPEEELMNELMSPDKSETIQVPYGDMKEILKTYNFKDIESYIKRDPYLNKSAKNANQSTSKKSSAASKWESKKRK